MESKAPAAVLAFVVWVDMLPYTPFTPLIGCRFFLVISCQIINIHRITCMLFWIHPNLFLKRFCLAEFYPPDLPRISDILHCSKRRLCFFSWANYVFLTNGSYRYFNEKIEGMVK